MLIVASSTTAKVPTDELMDKQNGVYTYNGTLSSLKRGNSDTCFHIDEP